MDMKNVTDEDHRQLVEILAGLSQIWGGAAPVLGCRRPVKQAVHFNRVLG